jgi:signal peptidase
MVNTNEEKKKMGVIHHFYTVMGILLCIVLIPILVINISFIVRSYLEPDRIPSLAGYFPLVVMTDSMDPEIESGDLVIYHTIDAEEVEVGDVISFYDPAGDGTSIVTHRVIDIVTDDGGLYFQTQGDANNTPDESLVPAENLTGAMRTIFPGAGHIALFMQSRTGLIVCVLIPLLIIIAYDRIRRRMYEKQKKADDDAMLAELEELRAAKN